MRSGEREPLAWEQVRAVQEETKRCWWTNVMMECCSESPLVDVLALN